MTTAKNAVFIGLSLENCYSMEGRVNFWWGAQKFGGGRRFSRWGI